MGVAFECFGSAEGFLAADLSNRFGCVVTDLRMMCMSGLDLQAKLAEMESTLPVILITAYASTPVVVKAMQSGAITFLEKICMGHELWQATKEALRKNEARQKDKHELDGLRGALATLTDDEQRVLELVAEGTLNKQVALKLGLSVRTVEARRRRVMQKLGVESIAELVRFVVKAEQASESE